MRVSAATALTALFALALLLLPRSFLAPVLGIVRPDEVPVTPLHNDTLEAAYPQELFSEIRGARETAPVYALGPGPYRYDLRVSEGSDAGLAPGMTAVLPDESLTPVLVGRVASVTGGSATIETIYDPAWKTAVRIGTSSVDALLVGGLTPTLTLIAKGAPVGEGDAVVSSDAAFPYGLALGTVTDIRDAEDGVLREATLSTPYSLGGLRAVDLLLDVRD